MAAAPPRLRTLRTVISCRWDTGGHGHRRIMAKHGVGVELLFCLPHRSSPSQVEFHSHPAALGSTGWPNVPSSEDIVHLVDRSMTIEEPCAELIVTPAGLLFVIVSSALLDDLLVRRRSGLKWFEQHPLPPIEAALEKAKHVVGYREFVDDPSSLNGRYSKTYVPYAQTDAEMRELRAVFRESGIDLAYWSCPLRPSQALCQVKEEEVEEETSQKLCQVKEEEKLLEVEETSHGLCQVKEEEKLLEVEETSHGLCQVKEEEKLLEVEQRPQALRPVKEEEVLLEVEEIEEI